MKTINKEEILQNNKKIFYDIRLEKTDLRYKNLENKKFIYCDLSNVNFEKANLKNISFENSNLEGVNFKNANLENANLKSVSLRNANLENANLKGAYFYGAVLEKANLENIITNEKTKWLKLFPKEKGAFLAYKKCLDDRLVTLLIPKEAKRTSATMQCCRTNKAKVLKITDFLEIESFNEAWSFVDENFCYKVGEWVEVKDFNEDRWFDSTTGIHFWLTKEDAIKY